jgi:septal ring factor EnvC (AmiA/AmiB activator)
MKNYLITVLTAACIGLAIFLAVTKRDAGTQQAKDAGSIASYSNQLWSAQTEIAIGNGRIITLSNSLDESLSVMSAFSNHLAEAQSNIVLNTEQIAGLQQQVAGAKLENQTLNQHAMDLTNQITGLNSQLTLTQSDLNQANKDYALLENRFRIDVAERLVVERKFNNPLALQSQLLKLKLNPAGEVSVGSIYAGLDVEVKAGRVHVITPN